MLVDNINDRNAEPIDRVLKTKDCCIKTTETFMKSLLHFNTST